MGVGRRPWLAFLVVSFLSSTIKAFAPVVPSFTHSQSTSHGRSRMSMVMDPHDVLNTAAGVMDHHHTVHDTFSGLVSTLYSKSVAIDLGHSIAPLKSGGGAASLSDHAIPPAQVEKAQKAIMELKKLGENVVDPASILRYDEVMPGFSTPQGILAPAEAIPKDNKAILYEEIKNMAFLTHVLVRLPMAVFLTVLVDFFIVSPGIEVYREDLEEDEMAVIVEGTKMNAVRVGVLLVVTLLTFFVTNEFG